MDFNIDIISEIDLEVLHAKSISTLLEMCFELYPIGQIHIHQIPHVRVLGYYQNNLICHAALHFRKISIDSNPTDIIGIGDFCVHPSHRNEGFGSKLIDEIILFSKKMHAISHIFCFTTEYDFYKKKGFKMQSAIFKWMLLSQEGTIGIAHRRLSSGIMMFSLNGQYFTDNCTIDLQGPPF